MANHQVLVKVKPKGTEDERIITYKAYLDTSSSFDLIGQSNEEGELIPGDPNLEPRHRKPVSAAAPVVEPVQDVPKIVDSVEFPPALESKEKPKKKRGPKPKLQEA